MKNELILHYEEYDGKDLVCKVTPDMLALFYRSLGYSAGKAEIIVGAIERLAFVDEYGLAALVVNDEPFYKFAKDYYRDEAEKVFGFEEYLICYIDIYGDYQETIVKSFAEANSLFDKFYANNLPAAIFARKKYKGGWIKKAMRSHKREMVEWRFNRRHVKKRSSL